MIKFKRNIKIVFGLLLSKLKPVRILCFTLVLAIKALNRAMTGLYFIFSLEG